MYRKRTVTVAATGTARNAPVIPNSSPPKATDSSTTPGCSSIERLWKIGDRMCPSNCCTSTITPSRIRALVRPTVTSATSTAMAPATKAPTMGMNPPKNVSTMSGSARGTCSTHRPMPMQTESMALTIACARMKPPKVLYVRDNASVRWEPAPRPAMRRTKGRKRGPSLMKKKVSTRASSSDTRTCVATVAPESTPLAILSPLVCSLPVSCLTALLSCVEEMLNGG